LGTGTSLIAFLSWKTISLSPFAIFKRFLSFEGSVTWPLEVTVTVSVKDISPTKTIVPYINKNFGVMQICQK
jgi:hypothetical protein